MPPPNSHKWTNRVPDSVDLRPNRYSSAVVGLCSFLDFGSRNLEITLDLPVLFCLGLENLLCFRDGRKGENAFVFTGVKVFYAMAIVDRDCFSFLVF